MKLYCLANIKIDELFKKEEGLNEVYDESFAFDRTISRLKEMQSLFYFNKKHKYLIEHNENIPELPK